MAGVEGTNKTYFCPTCGDKRVPGMTHAASNTERINVVVSSSTLHEFWLYGNYEGDSVHTDYITIPCATIASLEFAWRRARSMWSSRGASTT